MEKINKIKNIYAEIDDLIAILNEEGERCISDIIRHRMYKISWTSRSELFEELQKVLKNYIKKKGSNLDTLVVNRIEVILRNI